MEFAVWSAEIAEELAEARIALHEAEDQLAAAQQAANAERRAISVLVDAINSSIKQPAAAIMHRLGLRQAEARQVIGAVALTQGRVEACKARIADLHLAVIQLDVLAPAELADAA